MKQRFHLCPSEVVSSLGDFEIREMRKLSPFSTHKMKQRLHLCTNEIVVSLCGNRIFFLFLVAVILVLLYSRNQ